MSSETAGKKYCAARRLKGIRNPVKVHGEAGRKHAKQLAVRKADYVSMVAKPRTDGWVGYHRPGSMQR